MIRSQTPSMFGDFGGPRELFDLSGRTAIITGASSGLGWSIAHILARSGAYVVIAARRSDRLDALAGEIWTAGGKAMAVPADVTDADDCDRLIDQAVRRTGRMDILINNAGIAIATSALRETDEEWGRVISTNLTSAHRLSRLSVPHMGARSTIVNVSSILGLVTEAVPHAAYTASKAGLLGLTRELARQWAHKGIRVNAIAPGYFASEMTAQFADGYLEGIIGARVPLRRIGTTSDLAGPILFLATEASAYITGQVLVVDGGLTIT
jgi:NAD(P)-dependent dehydrogenase (short-subunit alcohol dehydrogenase family)